MTTTATPTGRSLPRADRTATTATGRLCLPLADVIARIDTGTATLATAVRLPDLDAQPVILPLSGPAAERLRSLIGDAFTRRYDTVRVNRSPSGLVVAVCRRRPRQHR